MGRFHLEYAKSARSTCKVAKCKQKIDKGAVRLGDSFEQGERTMTTWRHLGCVPHSAWSKALEESEDDVTAIEGYADLSEADQELVKNTVEAVMEGKAPPETPAKGEGGVAEEEEAEEKPKKKKAAAKKPAAKGKGKGRKRAKAEEEEEEEEEEGEGAAAEEEGEEEEVEEPPPKKKASRSERMAKRTEMTTTVE